MRTRFQSYSKPLCKLTSVLLMYAALQIVYLDFLPFLLGNTTMTADSGIISALTSENTHLVDLVSFVLPYDGMSNILLLGLALFAWYTPHRKIALWEKTFSWLCAAIWLMGYSFHITNDLYMLYSDLLSVAGSIITVFGGGIFLQHLLRWAKAGLSRLHNIQVPERWSEHLFVKAWAVIFICWLPFLLFRYPAGIEYDAYYQLFQMLGLRPLTAHNPVLSTLLMGGFVKLGGMLGSYNIGAFLFVLIQSLICSAILAYSVLSMQRFGVHPIWRVISVAIYALAVIYPNYLTALVKDAMFSAFVLLYITLLAEYILLPETKTTRHHICFAAVALLMCMLRNNGIIWVVFAMVLLGITLPFYRKKINFVLFGLLATVCLLYSGYGSALDMAGIVSGPASEPMSIPFQQTARYVRDYPEDVTPEEAEAIRAVLDYDHLAELYDPNLSDPVKSSFTGNEDALSSYFSVWFKHLLRHPLVYLEATMNNSYGYYYPFVRNFVSYSNPESAEGFVFDERLEFDYPSALNIPRTLLRAYVYIFESTPILMLLGSTGFQTWVIFYLFCAMATEKDKRKLYVVACSFVGVFVCIACPTFIWNGVRYALPYIYNVPYLLGITVFKAK